ncbi:MAG: alpha/beta hydrolase [Inquilinus sp.]|nr:alpha/beta hydrolase [Inquilinus sp.]
MEWLVATVFFYGVAVAAAFFFQRSLLYFPAGPAADAERATGGLMRTVSYTAADGQALGGWFHPPAGDLPTLVYFHGNAGHHGDRAFAILPYAGRGYGVLLAGYRGYGGNPGRPSEQGLYADGRAALDWLAGQGIAADKVVLYGESLGTGVAVQMATEVPVAGLVLQSPFTSAVDVGQNAYWFLPVRLLMWDRYDSLAKIGQVAAPLLVLHGESDGVIPSRFGRRLFEAAPEPKAAHFIPGGGHNNLNALGISELVLAFLGGLVADDTASGQ